MNVGDNQMCMVGDRGWGAGVKGDFQDFQLGWEVRLFTELRIMKAEAVTGAVEGKRLGHPDGTWRFLHPGHLEPWGPPQWFRITAALVRITSI